MFRKTLFILALLFVLPSAVKAQFAVPIVGGVATAPLVNGPVYQVFLNQSVTSFDFAPKPILTQQTTVIFTQLGGGGFTVAFASDIMSSCTVAGTGTTACIFQYAQPIGSWISAGGGGGGGGGSIGGSIANTQVAFGSGTNTIQGTNNATLDTSGDLTLAGILLAPQIGSLASPATAYLDAMIFTGSPIGIFGSTGSCGSLPSGATGGTFYLDSNNLPAIWNPNAGTCRDPVTWQAAATPGDLVVAGSNPPDVKDSGTSATGISPNMNVWYLSPNGCGSLTNCTPVKWDVKVEHDCSFTSSSATITCPEANFSSADVGKIEFGTFQESGYEAGTAADVGGLDVPQGTISSITSSTEVVVSVAATASCTATGGNLCSFAWGTQADDSGIATAEAAAWTNPTNCYTLEMPSGAAFVAKGHFDSLPGSACGGNGIQAVGEVGTLDTRQQGPELAGEGAGSTVLIPLPSFDYTSGAVGDSCGGIQSNNDICFGASLSLFAHDFTIDGLGVTSSSAAGLYLWFTPGGNTCSGVQERNLHFSNWNLTGGGVGFRTGSCAGSASNIYVQNFGSEVCDFAGGSSTSPYALSFVTCFGGDSERAVEFSGFISSNEGNYQGNYDVNEYEALVDSSTVFKSSNDFFGNQSPGITGILFGVSGTAFLSNDTLNQTAPGGTSEVVYLNVSGAALYANNTYFNGSAATNVRLLLSVSGSSFFDGGGNLFIEGGVANSISGSVFGSGSITGTTLATSNIGLTSGWGSGTTVSTASGDSHSFQFTITLAGTTSSPEATVTFPTAYFVAPQNCIAAPVAGTDASLITSVTVGTPSATSVTISYAGTFTASDTIIQGMVCQ